MLIKRPSKIKSSEITDQATFEQRRILLKAAAGLGIGSAFPGFAMSKSASVEENDLELTPYKHVTTYNNFYEFGLGKKDPARKSHTLRTRPWTIRVDGECEKPGEIGIEDILSRFDQEERIYRFRCVEAWAMVVPWLGFSLADFIKTFAPTSKARYVVFETLFDKEQMPGQRRNILDWPYVEGLRMDEAMNPLAFLSTGLYGKELPNQNGAPIRLVVPWKYGFKSIKSIVRMSFVEDMPVSSWNKLAPDEYGFYANVNPEVDHPRWSQARHRMLGQGLFSSKHETLMFNGYAEEVADLYRGMDLTKFY